MVGKEFILNLIILILNTHFYKKEDKLFIDTNL